MELKNLKKPFLFSLALLPLAAIGGYFIATYQIEMFDRATINQVIAQVGSMRNLTAIAISQSILYACILGFFGYILAEKIGLMKSLRFEKSTTIRTVVVSVVLGLIFSLDYWTFGRWIPKLSIASTTSSGLTLSGWLGAIFYGGVIEDLVFSDTYCLKKSGL